MSTSGPVIMSCYRSIRFQ